MSALRRIARELTEAQRQAALPLADRAYERLRKHITEGTEITLSDHDLVLAIQKALWEDQRVTVHLGLSELELRMTLTTERLAAA